MYALPSALVLHWKFCHPSMISMLACHHRNTSASALRVWCPSLCSPAPPACQVYVCLAAWRPFQSNLQVSTACIILAYNTCIKYVAKDVGHAPVARKVFWLSMCQEGFSYVLALKTSLATGALSKIFGKLQSCRYASCPYLSSVLAVMQGQTCSSINCSRYKARVVCPDDAFGAHSQILTETDAKLQSRQKYGRHENAPIVQMPWFSSDGRPACR